jgi:hypothetical protein
MKRTLVIAATLPVMFALSGLLVYSRFNSREVSPGDEEIKDLYCHVTADVRKTDVYCRNPELYRQHLRENKVIRD